MDQPLRSPVLETGKRRRVRGNSPRPHRPLRSPVLETGKSMLRHWGDWTAKPEPLRSPVLETGKRQEFFPELKRGMQAATEPGLGDREESSRKS